MMGKIFIIFFVSILIIVFLCYFGSMVNLDAGTAKHHIKLKREVINDNGYNHERILMVKSQIKARGIKDPKVLKAMETVPRHHFVPKKLQKYSYYDEPLSIGFNQTISQPYIVAFMTEILDLDKDDIILEIGTGSGYQAAVLSLLVKKIYTIEIISELGIEAKDRLKRLGYDNVEVKIGDGYHGWPDYAPFNAIIVTAAPENVPPDLIKQLKKGGKMIIPTGSFDTGQDLKLISKDINGDIKTKNVLPVRFVPLTRNQ